MGMPSEPILDIMRRTITNLEFVERHAGPEGPYEVTQLINSFIGALAHPWEAMRNDLSKLAISEAEALGWPRVEKERGADPAPSKIGELVRAIRNSVAHGNVEFLPDQRGEITALRIWNFDPRRKVLTWGAILTVSDMRRLLGCFVELIEQRQSQFRRSSPKSA